MTASELKFLDELLARLPKRQARRKDFLEIAGFPRWENVYSNLLAFYLDEQEEHGLGRLFLEALVDLALAARRGSAEGEAFELPDEAYQVVREESTAERKRIDLLIRPKPQPRQKAGPNEGEEERSSWAILIENKIDATLYNHLDLYLAHAHAKNKLAIVLSVHPLRDPKELQTMGAHGFINITHEGWMNAVRDRLPQYLERADDRHLLFLKDYFSAVNRLYQGPMATQDMEATLKAFLEYGGQIWQLEQANLKVAEYTTKAAIEAMESLGYRCDTKNVTNGKHFWRAGAEHKDDWGNLRIWFWLDSLRLRNDITFYWELHGKATKDGDKIRKMVQDAYPQFPAREEKGITIGTSGSKGGTYFHLLRFQLDLGSLEGRTLAQRIADAVRRELIESGVRDRVLGIVGGGQGSIYKSLS